MLISRVADSASSGSRSTTPLQERMTADRGASLNHLWHKMLEDVQDAASSGRIRTEFECEYFDTSAAEWLQSSAVIQEEGVLRLYKPPHSDPFLSIGLRTKEIVGHVSQGLIQITGEKQVALLRADKSSLAPIYATLLLWSRLRPAGIEPKIWFPPMKELSNQDADLLRCEVQAHFTAYSPYSMQWAPFLAKIKRSGLIQLTNTQLQVVYSLQVSDILGSRIKVVDPSIVDSNKVLLLFPDKGGPDSVYLKFNDIDDFEDWVATLKSLSLHPVASPIDKNPTRSVRWHRSTHVKVGACEVEDNQALTTIVSDLNDTYVDICISEWVVARTLLNTNSSRASWGQSFSFSGPETNLNGSLASRELEFRLMRRSSKQSGIGSENDYIIGSLIVPQSTSEEITKWYYLTPSNFKINITTSITEFPILDASYYQRLYDWMSDLSLHSTGRLVAGSPSSLSSLFPIFDEIYRAQGRQVEWILSLVTEEMKTINVDSDTIFREASLLTRSVESLLQQQGGQILQNTVGRFVRKLIAGTDDSLELDPSRNRDAEVIKSNTVAMRHFMQYLWSLIRSEGVPQVIKPIFRHMKASLNSLELTEEQQQKVMTRASSSLLFLRFYVPALLHPQAYNLTDRVLEAGHRRTLVLVAKILQGFANRVKFGSKEMWLAPMNNFIEEHESSLVQWYAEICCERDSGVLSIRKVDIAECETHERPPKELPVETFMSQQLTSPNLIDEWEVYAKLVRQIVTDADDEFTSSDSLVTEFVSECQSISKAQEELISSLEAEESLDPSAPQEVPQLYFNKETLLFGANSEQLGPDTSKSKRSSPISDSISRLSWLPKSISFTDIAEEARNRPTSSVRKLTQMLRISKSTSSSSSSSSKWAAH